jgi:hypothetical protein
MNVMVISNAEFGDVTFDSDRGSWNVTRALRDCLAGQFNVYRIETTRPARVQARHQWRAARGKRAEKGEMRGPKWPAQVVCRNF